MSGRGIDRNGYTGTTPRPSDAVAPIQSGVPMLPADGRVCAVCGSRPFWRRTEMASHLKPNGERFYLCPEDEALRAEGLPKQGEK